jgi:protein SCO1/2
MSFSSQARLVSALIAALLAGVLLVGCSAEAGKWNGTDVEGIMPDLSFTMTRASDGKEVTAAEYDGKVKLLFFGYTFCPDICPLTLANVSRALEEIGKEADAVRVLFVTVDPERDTLEVLKEYTSAFAPQVVGLRGTPDQIALLAKRYRAAHSVEKNENGEYVVTHSPSVYVFDEQGRARLIYTDLNSSSADIEGLASDLKRLIEDEDGVSFLF